MEEKNDVVPSETNEEPKKEEMKKPEIAKSKEKQCKKENKASFSTTVADYKAEFKKIIWPKRDELSKKTGTVIITSLLIGVTIFCMDTVYTTGYNFILTLLG